MGASPLWAQKARPASAQDATPRPRPAWDIAADCLKGIGRELVVVLAHDSDGAFARAGHTN